MVHVCTEIGMQAHSQKEQVEQAKQWNAQEQMQQCQQVRLSATLPGPTNVHTAHYYAHSGKLDVQDEHWRWWNCA